MSVFSDAFKVQVPDHSGIDMVADESAVAQLRDEMRADKIDVDGKLLGGGLTGLVFETSATGDSQKIPGAVTRIEHLGAPLLNPVVLRPAFSKEYLGENGYQVHIVPYAPDIKDQPVKDEDILRTIRVLKATGHTQHLVDITPDNFAFLKDAQGEVIRYPGNAADMDFRNKPIAFVRDLNACLADKKMAMTFSIMGNAETTLEKMNTTLETLPPAPADCVEACKQQYALTDALANSLNEHGIAANVEVPDYPRPDKQWRASETSHTPIPPLSGQPWSARDALRKDSSHHRG